MHIRKGFENVTVKQLELMAHTIGFERRRIKYNKFTASRNFFTTKAKSEEYDDLEELVKLGLMKKQYSDDDKITYSLSIWGTMLFVGIFNCKVVNNSDDEGDDIKPIRNRKLFY